MNKSGHAITDIEFLSRRTIEPRNQIIYLYQRFSGVLRFKVRDRIIEFAKRIGCMPCDPPSTLQNALCSPSVFEEPPFFISDLRDIKQRRRGKDDIDVSLQLIAAGLCNNRALLTVSSAEGVSVLDSWRDAIGACTYIEEPLITPENLSVALRYLTKTSDLGDFTQLAGPRRVDFIQKFEAFVRERPRTLAELEHRFDRIALYYYDSPSAPRITDLEKSVSARQSPLATRLGNFVNSRDEITLGPLLILVDGWRWQKKIDIIIQKVRLYDATISLLSDRKLARAATRDESQNSSNVAHNFRDRLCWAILLLSWEKDLVEDNFIAALDRLCRNFLLCRTAAEDGGALRERWGDITLQIAIAEDPDSSRLAESRTRLRTLLGERLSMIDPSAQPAWVKDLRLIWASPKIADEGAPRTQVMEEEDRSAAQMRMTELLERHRPKRFEEVLGQDELVSTLRRRVITEDHSQHIVLHGPEGSGKISVARLYAKASQCAEPTQTGSPCQRCEPCRAFGQFGGGFNYREIDAETQGDVEYAYELFHFLIGNLRIADRSAIVVKNADKLSGRVADMLLKTVEELYLKEQSAKVFGKVGDAPTTFIFVLDEVSALQPALRSRAQAFRLLPLVDKDALNHLASVCQTENFSYEDPALEAIVRDCRAFAGQSLRKLFEIANLGAITLARTLEVCGLNWGDKMLACWRALLANERNEGLSLFEELGPDSVSRVRAMQSFLLTIYLRALCSSPLIGGHINPAIDQMSAESWGFVVDGLRDRAITRGMTLDELGSELVSFWADSRMPRIRLSAPLGEEHQKQEAALWTTLRPRYLRFHDLLNEAGTGESAR
jgi:DNA polymerase III delta prime subunit